MRTLWRIIAGFFKWTWRLLNFVRNLVMNIFFILLVLVCAGIWMHISNANQAQHSTRGALLLDITGVIVDKPWQAIPADKWRLGHYDTQHYRPVATETVIFWLGRIHANPLANHCRFL